ncbi:hypothetical protein DICPUDRAFT_148600 [Dictyostelium purpureum]|uniref:Uncharacterized protein n=1 Tax=Dictyostelium purpureum TaxID=5786 RepID=F0ZBJ2_DICPU|nr:uncharacterized protein DICPUDRAFT_148600 [Dictyostelium purpureum]EGC38705.1 hypothetical protein DICPUDRAFT_148600 [Dictyostelium purpureum]|eukprot:XP_003284801.1 hypothetical protein DICPUDRAFT_148600 [Dictyostelium purpureum]
MRPEAQVPPAQRQYYEELFLLCDSDKDGVIGLTDASFFRYSMLPNEILREVWQIADVNNGYLNIEDFIVALKLISLAQMGAPVTLESVKSMPVVPPPRLSEVPPMKNDWAISNSDKQNYIDLFNKYDDDQDGYILGSQAKSIFSSSGLPAKILGHIWNLSDLNKDQKLDCQEFIIAAFLIRSVLKGYELPVRIPESLITSSHYISSAGVPSPKIPEWMIPPTERIVYEDLFNKNQQSGYFTGQQAKVLFEKSNLSIHDLKLIWDLADYNQEQYLDKQKFVIAMFLINQRKKGKELPQSLPNILMESSKSNFNPAMFSPTHQSQASDSDSKSSSNKYNINLNDIVGNISNQSPISSGGGSGSITNNNSVQSNSGGLNVSNSLVSPPPQQLQQQFSQQQLQPPPQQQSPNIGSTPQPQAQPTLQRQGSFTFDSNTNLIAKPPAKPGSVTRMNSFSQVSPQSSVSNSSYVPSPQSSLNNNNNYVSSPQSSYVQQPSQNMNQLYSDIDKAKQISEQEKIKQEDLSFKFNQEVQLEAELKQQLEDEQKQLQVVQEMIKTEESNLQMKKQSNSELKEHINTTRSDIKSSKVQLEQTLSLLKEKTELYDEQREQLNQLNDDLQEKQQELEKNRKELEFLLASIESIKQNRSDVKNQLATIAKLINESKAEIKQLAEEQKQQKQQLQQEQQQLQQQQQQQQQLSSSKPLSAVKSDDNISFATSIAPANNTTSSTTTNNATGDEWDFFGTPTPSRTSTSLPTSPFDDKFSIPFTAPSTTTNPTTTNPMNTSNNSVTFSSSPSSSFINAGNNNAPSPVKSNVSQLKTSSSSVGRKYSGDSKTIPNPTFSSNAATNNSASVSSNNSFTDNSVDTMANAFGSEQFSFSSYSTSKQDPFGESAPFGEDTTSVKDAGSETLSEAHALFDNKDSLFETNESFQSSKDPFGQIIFSSFNRDSFVFGSSSENQQNNSNIISENGAFSQTNDNDFFSSNNTVPNNNSNDFDGFEDFAPQSQTLDQQPIQQEQDSQQQPEFGVKFNDNFDFGSSNFNSSNLNNENLSNDPFNNSLNDNNNNDNSNNNNDPFSQDNNDNFNTAPQKIKIIMTHSKVSVILAAHHSHLMIANLMMMMMI